MARQSRGDFHRSILLQRSGETVKRICIMAREKEMRMNTSRFFLAEFWRELVGRCGAAASHLRAIPTKRVSLWIGQPPSAAIAPMRSAQVTG